MQVLVLAICRRGSSVRDAIAKHPKLHEHNLKVTEQKRQDRPRGWTKVHSTEPNSHGAINIEWDADTNILLARVVTRGKGRPNRIIGHFVDFLLTRFRSRIQAINILPPA